MSVLSISHWPSSGVVPTIVETEFVTVWATAIVMSATPEFSVNTKSATPTPIMMLIRTDRGWELQWPFSLSSLYFFLFVSW